MSQVFEFPKCANADCKNRITKFEIDKIMNYRSMARCIYEFCSTCRHRKDSIHRLICIRCKGVFTSKNIRRHVCTECKNKARRRLCCTPREQSTTQRIIDFFNDGGVLVNTDIYDKFGISTQRFSDIVSHLKGQDRIKIKRTTYYSQEKLQ